MRNRYICTNKEIKQIACEYIADEITIRELSAKYEIARSTTHRYLHEVLREIDLDLAKQVAKTARRKKYEGQVRGGKAHKAKRREQWK